MAGKTQLQENSVADGRQDSVAEFCGENLDQETGIWGEDQKGYNL